MRRIAETLLAPLAIGLMLAAVFAPRAAHAVTYTWIASGTTQSIMESANWDGSPTVNFLTSGTNTDLVFGTNGTFVNVTTSTGTFDVNSITYTRAMTLGNVNGAAAGTSIRTRTGITIDSSMNAGMATMNADWNLFYNNFIANNSTQMFHMPRNMGNSSGGTRTLTNSGTGTGWVRLNSMLGTSNLVQDSLTSSISVGEVASTVAVNGNLTIRKGLFGWQTPNAGPAGGTITLGYDAATSTDWGAIQLGALGRVIGTATNGQVLTVPRPIVMAGSSGTYTIRSSQNTYGGSFAPVTFTVDWTGGVTGSNSLYIENTTDTDGADNIRFSTGSINMAGKLIHVGAGSGAATIDSVIGTNVTEVIQNSASSRLVLGGANTFSGNTTVQAGILALNNVNALQNSTLDVGPAGSQQVTFTIAGNNTYNLGGLTGSDVLAIGGNSLQVGSNNQSTTYAGGMSGSGGLAKVGAGTLTLSGMNTATGPTVVDAGVLAVSGQLTAGTTVSGLGTLSFSGGRLAAASNLTVSSGVALPGAGTFDSAGFGVDVTGNMTGAGSLTKAGAGWLRLSSAAGGYSGGSTVSAGGLIFGTRAAQPVTGTTTVASGATLGLGVSASDAAYFDSADLDALFAGSLDKVGNTSGVSNVGIDTTAGNFTYASAITGPRGLVKYGPNTLTLSGASSYSGGTDIVGGIVQLANATALGTGTATISAGAIDLGGFSITNPLVVAGGTLSGGTIGGQVSAAAGAISATLTGAGGFTKTGTGTLVLSANNTYAGATSIQGGSLRVESATGSLPTAGAVTLASTSGLVNLAIDNVGATGNLSQSVGPLSFTAGAGTVSLVQTELQDLLLTSSSISVAAGAAGNLVPSGANSATNGFASSQPAGFMSTRLYYGGSNFAWNDTTAGFIRGINYGTDAGTQTITTATTTVSGTTHLQLQANVTAQTAATFTTLAFTGSATSFTLSSAGQTITVAGILKTGTGTTTIQGANGGSGILRSSSNADLDIRVDDASGTLTLNPNGSAGHIPVILANGSNGLTKSGVGTLRLQGATTITGPTRPLEGTLNIAGANGANALQNSTLDMSAIGTGTVTFSIAATLGGLTGSRDLNLGGQTITIGNNNASTTYSGVLSNGTLAKTGTGILTLSGSSTYAGNTSINRGRIDIDWLANAGQASPLGGGTLINLGSSGTTGTLRYTGSGHTTDRAINLAGTTGGGVIEANGSGGLVLGGIGTATGAGTKTLTLTGTSTATNSIGPIAGTGVSVSKTGSGLWRLSGASTYTGRLTVSDGTLVVGTSVDATAPGPFGTQTDPVLLPILGSSTAGLTGTAALLADNVTIARGFSVAALGDGSSQVAVIGSTGSGTATFTNSLSIRLGRDVTLQAATGGEVVFLANWKDAAGGDSPAVAFTVGSAGNAGTVAFARDLPESITAVNIVRGTARVQGGDDRILYTTPVTIGSADGPAMLDLGGRSQSLGSVAFTGTGSEVASSVGGGTLRMFNGGSAAAVNVNGTSHAISSLVALDAATSFNVAASSRLLVSSAISEAGGGRSLTKTGLGILELAGQNTYSGDTTVSAGTLVLNGSLGAGALSVASNATLMGSGTIGGLATIFGTHSPGNSPGVGNRDGSEFSAAVSPQGAGLKIGLEIRSRPYFPPA